MKIFLAAVVPAYNEAAVIAQTIQSLLVAGMPRDDIFILNDASTDQTAEEAARFGVNIVSNKENLGKAESVSRSLGQLGLLQRYTHVCFLDADTLVDRGYFGAVRKALKKAPFTGVLCGNPKSLRHNWLTAWRAYQYFLADFIHKPGQASFRSITVAPGCAATYSVETLKKVRWSADTPTEDMDVTIQAALLGERIAYESNAIVYTQDPENLKDYVGQVGKRWDAGAWQIMHKYGIFWKGLFSPIHWECRISMMFEPLAMFLSLYWAWNDPPRLVKAIALTFMANIILAVFASYKEERWDIAMFSPLFFFLWLVDLTLFLGTSFNLITGPRFRRKRQWYSVERYTISEKET